MWSSLSEDFTTCYPPDIAIRIDVPPVTAITSYQAMSQNNIIFPWSWIDAMPEGRAHSVVILTVAASTTSTKLIHQKYLIASLTKKFSKSRSLYSWCMIL